MSVESPFTLYRFEYEPEHLYYLERNLFERIEQPKPLYVVGSRGTGKTTLLKALNWQERINNRFLRDALEGDPFASGYIGIYLKLPEIQLETLGQWLSSEEDSRHAGFVAFYLDLNWIEQACEALSELIAERLFEVDVSQEETCVHEICSDLGATLVHTRDKMPKTLRDLRSAVAHVRRDLELAAKLYHPPAGLIERYHITYQIGEFGRKVGGKLVELCIRPSATAEKDAAPQSPNHDPWHFKVCMDEGECLSSFHQVVVNTILRLAATPVFPVVSFVSTPHDITTTLVRNLTLQQADRDLLPLDDISDKDFRALAEGVATVRVRHALNNGDIVFDTKKVLGSLDINTLLLRILQESVSPTAKRLLEEATTLAEHPIFKNKKQAVPPIYQAYLVDRLKLQLPHPESDRWERRHQESAELRKKIVAAYLSICREIKIEPKYASEVMLFQMSDMCVRDYLHQIHEIFELSSVDLSEFLTRTVPLDVQDRALKAASDAKRNSVPQSGVTTPGETGSIIKGLGFLTARIQSDSKGYQHLRSTERGKFYWSYSHLPEKRSQPMLEKIREAAEAGFLRLLPSEEGSCRFRVHTSLAASFGFSYRGASYDCPIDIETLERLRSGKDDQTLQVASNEIAEMLGSTRSQNMDIFADLENERDSD